jgi:predicted transcriptional regulator
MSNTQNNNVIDISIDSIRRKRYRINGDDNKILELNPTDFNITVRMNEAYPKLTECESKITELSNSADAKDSSETLEGMSKFADTLSSLNNEMCELIDYIFDSNVSEVCCDGGSMYDLINGFMRYEIIVDNLVKLYETNLSAEVKKVQRRVKKHTAKYTKK